ncbi:MAG: PAC2 family protein [Candidatus Heimdallarchaeum aukensis]|uniref:PAC2 family protein n=1 Tax=Candidatus Heimdallarchaeum aukensis TaxID=2876573 RepID=A0A9Y1FLX1_9ARCH|nr:MAG: PAC2 family protein [Candidatus Heimdallarchaeum aukensis]
MKESLVISQHFSIDSNIIDENTTVIIGFSGYGSVGRLVANHLAETFKVTPIGFWGPVSWFHNDRIEAPITVFKLDIKSNDPKEKFVLVSSRLNVPVIGVRAFPDVFWKMISQEILSWKAKRYIAIGGLREEIRNSSNDSWVALIPTVKYSEQFGVKRTFKDHLSIKGPIHYLLMESSAYSLATLVVLSYCNTFEADSEAALIALKELEKIFGLDLKSDKLNMFDSSFVEPDEMIFWETEDSFDEFVDDDDFDSFDEEFDEEYDEGEPLDFSSKKDDVISFDVYKEFHNKGDKLDKYK